MKEDFGTVTEFSQLVFLTSAGVTLKQTFTFTITYTNKDTNIQIILKTGLNKATSGSWPTVTAPTYILRKTHHISSHIS